MEKVLFFTSPSQNLVVMINKKLQEVLFIDDDKILNFVNTRLFKKEGFSRVICFENGNDAVVYMKKKYTGPKIEHDQNLVLIFLDLNMPYMNGWEFLKVFDDIKDVIITQIKIIILTSSFNPEEMEKGKKHKDVVAYINKPLTSEMLSKVLKKYV